MKNFILVVLTSWFFSLILAGEIDQELMDVDASQKFQPASNATSSSSCPQGYDHLIGDGWCDSGFNGINLNIQGCKFDGGDCCIDTCGTSPASNKYHSVSFYCGVAGYFCLDPKFVNKVQNTSTTSKATGNSTLIVLSEKFYVGSALLVNVTFDGRLFSRKNIMRVTDFFQYLAWSALENSAANAIVSDGSSSDGGSNNPHPPKPPLPPRPLPAPPSSDVFFSKDTIPQHRQSFVLKDQLYSAVQKSATNEVKLYNGERWLVSGVVVNSQVYARKYAVASISWVMSHESYQLYYNANVDGNDNSKSTLSVTSSSSINETAASGVISTVRQQQETWLNSELLERSLRYTAQVNNLDTYANVKVCQSSTYNATEGEANLQGEFKSYSVDEVEECLRNYTTFTYQQSMTVSSLYESSQCQRHLHKSWQSVYNTDGYVSWLFVYVILWIFVFIIALTNLLLSMDNKNSTRQTQPMRGTHQLLQDVQLMSNNDEQAHINQPHNSFAETNGQLSGRRHHRRRVLERVLSFYSQPLSTTATDGNDGTPYHSEHNDHDTTNNHVTVLSQLWLMLRIPGFFSRRVLSCLVVITSMLRLSHYLWILTPYLRHITAENETSASSLSDTMSLLVCREFAYSMMATETMAPDMQSATVSWMYSYLLCLWLVAFHTFLSWTLVSAIARHVYVAIRRCMVTLSLPYLPDSPNATSDNNNHNNPSNTSVEIGPNERTVGEDTGIVMNQTNPMSRKLPHAPLSEGVSSNHSETAAGFASHPSSLFTPQNSVNFDYSLPVRDNQQQETSITTERSRLHDTLVPALFHLQLFHCLILCIIVAMLLLTVGWVVIGISVQETSTDNPTVLEEEIMDVLIAGKSAELFLYWVQRLTGAISVLEAVVLMSLTQWLSRLYYLVVQRSFPSTATTGLFTTGQWMMISACSLILMLQGVVTIIISQDYFHEDNANTNTDINYMEAQNDDENFTMQAEVVFAMYTILLHVLELCAVILIVFFLVNDEYQTNVCADANSVAPRGSGLSTPYYTEFGTSSAENSPVVASAQTSKQRSPMDIDRSRTMPDGNRNSQEQKVADQKKHKGGVGEDLTYGFGYGYEGAGPFWLGLQWVNSWQNLGSKEEKSRQRKSPSRNPIAQQQTAAADVEGGETKAQDNTSTGRSTARAAEKHRNWWGWYARLADTDTEVPPSHMTNTSTPPHPSVYIPHSLHQQEDDAADFTNADQQRKESADQPAGIWANPLSSMNFLYQPISSQSHMLTSSSSSYTSSAPAATLSPPTHSHMVKQPVSSHHHHHRAQWSEPPPYVSFQFPQLSSISNANPTPAASVVITDIGPSQKAVCPTPQHASTNTTNSSYIPTSDDGSVQSAPPSASKRIPGSWSSSLFARKSTLSSFVPTSLVTDHTFSNGDPKDDNTAENFKQAQLQLYFPTDSSTQLQSNTITLSTHSSMEASPIVSDPLNKRQTLENAI